MADGTNKIKDEEARKAIDELKAEMEKNPLMKAKLRLVSFSVSLDHLKCLGGREPYQFEHGLGYKPNIFIPVRIRGNPDTRIDHGRTNEDRISVWPKGPTAGDIIVGEVPETEFPEEEIETEQPPPSEEPEDVQNIVSQPPPSQEPIPLDPEDPTTVINITGAKTYLELSDTNSSYEGEAGKVPVVKDSEDGLEFRDLPNATPDPGSGSDPTPRTQYFVQLLDTPNFIGSPGQYVAVSNDGAFLTYIDPPDPPPPGEGGGGGLVIHDVPPPNPAKNTLWWDSETKTLKIYRDDAFYPVS